MKIAIFPGSFDPFTIGHYDIVRRALPLFDHIIIGIGQNSVKTPLFPTEQRKQAIEKVFANTYNISVRVYDCLTATFAKQMATNFPNRDTRDATPETRNENEVFILRGVRCVADFEYERNMAEANKELAGVETILLYTAPEYAHISSTLVRDLQAYGEDIKRFLP